MDLLFGIDIASKEFVSFNECQGFGAWENSLTHIDVYLKSLPEGAVLTIESTGSFGTLLAEKAVEAGFTVYIVQPHKVKKYRESAPDVRGKSDRIDARAIHDYTKTYLDRLHPYQPLPSYEAKLRKMTRTRDGIVRHLSSLRTQLRSLGDSAKAIKATLKGLEARVKVLDGEIAAHLAKAQDASVLFSIPCVKSVVIGTVLPALRTIPFKSKYSLAKYAGMDLKPNESGKMIGRNRISKEGDKHIRRALYMAAMSATHSKAWKSYYNEILKEKKLSKTAAINVLARKILHTIYGVYKAQKNFQLAPGG